MKRYYKISHTNIYIDRNHFYKMLRFVFFERLIFTVDIYPSEISLGIMLPNYSWSKTLLRIV